MKKQLLSISLLAALLVTGCGNNNKNTSSASSNESTSSTLTSESSSSETPVSTSSSSSSQSAGPVVPPPVIITNNFAAALKKDYTNMTVQYALNSAEVGSEYGTEYYCGKNDFVAVLDGTTAETFGTAYAWSFYTFYEGKSYTYWDNSSYVTEGWISNGSKNHPVGIDYAYFYMPYFINCIDENDVTNVMGAYVVKAESIDKVLQGLKFTFMTNDITYVDITLDESGYIKRIRGFDDINNDEYGFIVEMGYFNITSVPTSAPVPPEIGPDTIKTYAEMIGHEEIPDIYMTEMSIVINDPVESDDTYQIIMNPDDAVDLSFSYQPANANVTEVTWHTTNEEVAELLYSQQSGHHFLRAVKQGEAEIYLTHINEYNETITSKRVKVKVKAPQQVQESAEDVYRFSFTGTSGESGHNTIGAVNTISGSEAPYTIKAWRMETRSGNYSDNFQEDDIVLFSAPNSSNYFNERFEDEVVFDFENQQVNKVSFAYALFRCNSKTELGKLESITLSTSNDGENWADIDITDEMRAEFEKASLNTGMTPKVLSKEFLPASMMKLVIKADSIGGYELAIGMKDFIFSADENCRDYDDVDAVPVTSINISAPSNRLKVGSSMRISASILPEDASNKNVRWVSDNTEVLTIDYRSGLATALKAGTAKIIAISTSNKDMVSNELTITVYEQEEIYDPNNLLVGKKFYAENVASGANRFNVTFDIKDNKNAVLTLSFTIEGVGTFDTEVNASYDSFDALTGRYEFLSEENGVITLLVAEDGSYIELTYKKGNEYTLGDNGHGVILNKVN